MRFILTLVVFLFVFNGKAQFKEYSFGEELRYTAPDSSFGIKASARFQTLFIADWKVHNDDFADIGNLSSNFLIRRARLKFDGFAYSPKLKYKVELALSNRDINHNGAAYYGEGANIVLDAYLKWNFFKDFYLKAGQFKLAGNRERLISSADLQFVDRSLLNSKFTLDRDIGASLHYESVLGKQFGIELIAAFTQGEGRNIISGNLGGYQSTFKAEIMPFGKFKSKGAYKGGDLAREESPKLAFAIAFDYNNKVARTRGNKGSFLPTTAVFQDVLSTYADFMFKYKGFSMMGEYVYRETDNNTPKIEDVDGNFLGLSYYTGSALNLQTGYLFKNNYELSLRYTQLRPQNLSIAAHQNNYMIGASKYFEGHSLKVQTDVGYLENDVFDDGLTWRVQIEFGL